jgi:hypothetical protein
LCRYRTIVPVHIPNFSSHLVPAAPIRSSATGCYRKPAQRHGKVSASRLSSSRLANLAARPGQLGGRICFGGAMGRLSSAMRPCYRITAALVAAYLSGGLPADPLSNAPEAIRSSIAAARLHLLGGRREADASPHPTADEPPLPGRRPMPGQHVTRSRMAQPPGNRSRLHIRGAGSDSPCLPLERGSHDLDKDLAVVVRTDDPSMMDLVYADGALAAPRYLPCSAI